MSTRTKTVRTLTARSGVDQPGLLVAVGVVVWVGIPAITAVGVAVGGTAVGVGASGVEVATIIGVIKAIIWL